MRSFVLIMAALILAGILTLLVGFLSLCVLFKLKAVTLPGIKDVEPGLCPGNCDDCKYKQAE